METIVLVFPETSVTLESLADALASCGEVALAENVITVRFNASSIYIVPDTTSHFEDIFEEWPDHLLSTSPVAIFSLDYRNKANAAQVIASIAKIFPVIIDTNFGHVGPGFEFTIQMLDRHD